MKIRSDFVTNSSSSSFLLAFDSKEDAIAKLIKHLSWNTDALGCVIRDITEASAMTEEEIAERLDDEAGSYAYWIIHFGEGSWWSSTKDTWEKRWMDKHPDAKRLDMREDPEYQAEYNRLKDKFKADILPKLQGKAFICELEYSDNDGLLFSELEHDIMPTVPGLVKSFSHH